EQIVPSAFAGFAHRPVAGSHTPASWQPSRATQVTPKQRSTSHRDEQPSPPWVLPSSHSSDTSSTPLPHTLQSVEAEQAPVAGSQVPPVRQPAVGVQVTGSPPVQLPAWQVSVRVQLFPSLQLVPSATAGFEQEPLARSQMPAVWH